MSARRKQIVLVLAVCALALPLNAPAQISPGDLAQGHAGLEGIGNCTKCHSLGKSISNDKCLACHTELRTRMTAGTGFHARQIDRQCMECHKEHHGRTFPLKRLDPKTFDHRETGFVLEGRHRNQECEKCHTAGKIVAKDVLGNKDMIAGHTLLGLSRDCNACHADVHKTQLGSRCEQCHTADAFKPAGKFVHDRARFRLTGKHVDVLCTKCHRVMPSDGKTVKFAGLDFAQCQSCHTDPHKGKFQKPCESCHSTDGWNTGAAKNFNHAATRFPLKGSHATLRCESCHVPIRSGGGGKVVQSFEIKKYQKCADCHTDMHKGEFAGRPDKGACESCHTEKGFAPAQFSHATTRFALTGKHESIDCRKCHGDGTLGAKGKREPSVFVVKRFGRCVDCHTDAHAGQFARRADKGACESCHTVSGFIPVKYTTADHRNTGFSLAGGHEAVPCAQCHAANVVNAKSTRRFAWKPGLQCETCHRDPHGGQFVQTRYAGCSTCHSPKAWRELTFSHANTNFPLTGKHVGVACSGCHKTLRPGGSGMIRQFAETPKRCVECHPQIEGTPAGVTSR